MTNELKFLDESLGQLFRPIKKKRKADPDYGRFRQFCKKHRITYEVSTDGYVDVCGSNKESASFGFCESVDWGYTLMRLKTLIETGIDPESDFNKWRESENA